MNLRHLIIALVLIAIAAGNAMANPLSPGSPSYTLLEALVNINTSTDNSEGLDKARALFISELQRRGFAVRIHDLSHGHRLLVADHPKAQPKLLLVGHMDTVFKRESSFQKLRAEGDKLYGPGIIDMKGGLVLLLDLLSSLDDDRMLQSIRIMVNDDEETGSTFSKKKMAELSEGIPDVLVFEPGLPDGAVVTSQSGVKWIRLTVTGEAAHAGLEPERGINACVELANKIMRLAALSEEARDLTVTTGVIKGGKKPNIICDRASAMIDIRYRSQEDLTAVLKQAESIRREMRVHNRLLGRSPTATIEAVAELPRMGTEASRSLFKMLHRIAASKGVSITGRHVGYGSDGNHLAAKGHNVLVGLGPYGSGMHTEREYMSVDSYESRLKLDTELVRAILRP